MTQPRNYLTGAEKLAILRRWLVDKVPVSDLCDEHKLQPSQLYSWQAQLFEHGAGAFERKGGRRPAAETVQARKIAQLEARVAQQDAKLTQKNEVISELMEANVREKNAMGSSKRPLGAARHARCRGRLREALESAGGGLEAPDAGLAGTACR